MASQDSPTDVQAEWIKKWETKEIPWHKLEIDNNIQLHLEGLTQGNKDASILVTWCGKTVDMTWLVSLGYSVVGIEVSERAIREYFEESSIPYSLETRGEFTVYKAQDRKLTIFHGDYYEATSDVVGNFDAIWDNNAFGSSPPARRDEYSSVLASLLKTGGRVLLANWEYGQLLRDTYPYSLTSSTLRGYFEERFKVKFVGIFTDYFKKKFGVDFAHRNVHLLSMKAL